MIETAVCRWLLVGRKDSGRRERGVAMWFKAYTQTLPPSLCFCTQNPQTPTVLQEEAP